jgi:carbonic anhydrase/acetyltransferase-like protein (isoleucine patch superfamily)
MPIIPFENHTPRVESSGFIAPDAWVIGDVEVKGEASIFFGAVLRGDILPIKVGERSNIQEHAMLHTSHGLSPCIVGREVTVGHRAIIHGATVKDRCIIGMGSTLLDGAVVEENCIIGAHSLVTMGTVIPAGHLALGSPAKPVRKLNEAEIRQIRESARSYVATGKSHAQVLSTLR